MTVVDTQLQKITYTCRPTDTASELIARTDDTNL